MKKIEEKGNCSICNLPLIYNKEYKGTHPKQLLENSLKKKFKTVNLQFQPVVTKNSFAFVSKLLLNFSDKKREYFNQDLFGSNKKDSEAKISLFAYHKLICEEKI